MSSMVAGKIVDSSVLLWLVVTMVIGRYTYPVETASVMYDAASQAQTTIQVKIQVGGRSPINKVSGCV